VGIAGKSFRSLLPPSWRLGVDLRAVIEALGLSFDRMRTLLRGVLTESNPSTAVDTLPEWYDQLGLIYDVTQTLAVRQARAKQAYSSLGGQSIGYLNEQLQIAYPDVYLEEIYVDNENMVGYGMVGLMMVYDYPTWITSPPTDGTYPNFYYRVLGEVDDTYDLNGIKNLLSRIMPAPYEPVFAVTIRNLTPTGQVGIGMVGLMMVGRED
jgi:hypothetical protein